MILRIANFIKTVWYWIISGILLLVFFMSKGHSFIEVFYFITFLLPVVIGTSYYVNKHLIPDYLLRKKKALFILYSVYTLIVSLYLQYLIIFLALYIFTIYQVNNQFILSLNVGNLSLTLYLLVLIHVLIEIIRKLNQKEIIIKRLESNEQDQNKAIIDKIIVRFNRMNHQIILSDILYIESLSDYIKIITEKDEIITKEKISTILERLPEHFKRSHRSFIVNAHKVNSYNKEFLSLSQHQIPISRSFKKSIIAYLDHAVS